MMVEQSTSQMSSDGGEQGKERKARRTFPRLSGGYLFLDFVNTVVPRIGEDTQDFLTGPADLIRWSHYVELITEERAQELLVEINAAPEAHTAIFEQAIALREASHRVLVALIHQATPAPTDIQVIQSIFMQVRKHEHLALTGQHLTWQLESAEKGSDLLYWQLARSAETLLTTSLMERVKECPVPEGGCGFLFVDRSKNRSRQWCSDEACGSMIRMRRLYARKRANAPEKVT